MIDYPIKKINFVGLNIINGVIGMESETPLPVHRSTKRTLCFPTDVL